MQKVVHQKISVNYEYPVVFTRGALLPGNLTLKDILAPHIERHPHPLLLVYIDEGVTRMRPGLPGDVVEYVARNLPKILMVLSPVIVPGGEGIKSDRSAVRRIMQQMADARLDRHSYVMAIGGGAVLDAVGYAASLVHRGVRMIRMPATVLAQNDAGVGVKTAINDAAGKNFYGTFAPPFAVVNDLDFLDSLSDEDWRSGIAEAFKVALIKDGEFFSWLVASASLLAERDAAAMEYLIVRCAELHLEHIRTGGDPFEMGEARPLDYGHWSAHQIESSTGYEVTHGQAVAIGIMLDAIYSMLAGWLDERSVEALHRGLRMSGFLLWHECLERRDISGRLSVLAGLDRFREHLGGPLCITMPVASGASREISEMDEARIAAAIAGLKDRAAGPYDRQP